jgi:hypothetical protein
MEPVMMTPAAIDATNCRMFCVVASGGGFGRRCSEAVITI